MGHDHLDTLVVKFKPEFIPLAVNICVFLYHVFISHEPGKMVYWLGATLITVGLLFMKG